MKLNNNNISTWTIVIYTILIAAICFLSSIVFVKCNDKEKTVTKIEYITDTIIKRKVDSVYVDRYFQLPGRIDTVLIFNNKDSIEISGYALDTIYIEKLKIVSISRDTIVHDTIIITNTVNKQIKHFGFGFQAGFAAVYGLNSKKFDCGPSVGVGLIYKF